MSNHGRFLLRAGFNALLGAGRKQQALLPVGAVVSPSSLPDSQREDSYGQKRQRDPFLTSSSKRLFHSTANREILPLVAAGAVVFIGRYSWKALNRMDEDWEDYLWELKQYERARVQAKADATITIGVDLGTFYLKLSRVNKNKPQLIETAQGDRYRFNGILSQDDDVIMGKPALEKFFYEKTDEKTDDGVENNDSGSNKVVLPYMELQNESNDDATALVQKVFVPAVAEAMERVMSDGGSDASSDEKKNLRTVLTLPPLFYNKHGDGLFRKNYHDNSHQTITVPEPVAAIWGAQALNLIPTPESKEENSTSSTMVMDIGGLASTISLVRDDKVVASVSLDGIGGENFVQQLVDRILVETGDETMGKEPMTLTMIQTNARSSALELVNKTQSKIHIPFLYMGRRPDDPHLETTISRAVLEQAVQDGWSKSIIPKLVEENMLSSSLPIPKDVTSLFTSAVTKVLEESNEIPTNIERILLVGGGSRHKLFEEACKESITALMGPANYQSKIVIPETSLRAELTALGAASLLPNFDYDYDKGLENV
ncbi:unnamed protein product [Pseudo-nitzschia multistriata]|uniref:Uncharacterized protein n=1 Tax=Pseudo-nitzschia multistriata TaxID=183589 RepID=A0A448ZK38_9STRA|nr:unnamed protein product [Pseudo-nitzschia multistriata]